MSSGVRHATEHRPRSSSARSRLPSWPASVLAAICYLPLLLTARGKVVADTKEYLYLDPGRMLSRATSMWDPHIGMGTVTHQNIGYLWPMGPWYWLFQQLGFPVWIAQRLWTGSLLFFAGLGVLFLLRSFRWAGGSAFVAALTYALSPYALEYEARTSAILLPFAGLPWLLGIAVRSLRQADDATRESRNQPAVSRWTRWRRGWRWPAIFALVVVTVGSVNATSLLFAGLVPVLWVPWAIWGAREVGWRPALGVAGRTALLTLLTSLWWIVGLSIQSGYGIDVLRYSETVQTVATTSHPVEILRGLGNWYFYGRDRIDHWVQTSIGLLTFLPQLALSYFVPLLGIAAAAFLRWRHRAFFIGLIAIGTTIAVGVYPYRHPSPAGGLFRDFAQGSTAGLALRSTGRAVPLVALGFAVLLAGGVEALGVRASGRRLLPARLRNSSRRRPGSRRLAGPVLTTVVALLVVANLGPLWTGNFADRGLQGAVPVPAYWKQAAQGLQAKGNTTRVLELPGQDFAYYAWGTTSDPVTPGLMDRPFAGREITPYGEPGSVALMRAVDHRLQEGTFETASLPALARLMGAGDIVLRSDLQYERFPQPEPTATWLQFSRRISGLGSAISYGPTENGPPAVPYTTEITLGTPTGTPAPPAVADLPVTAAVPIVRAERSASPLLVDGDAEGLVDASSNGVLDSTGTVLFAGSLHPGQVKTALSQDADVLVTDSNRRRAERWGLLRDNFGYTEQAGETPLVADTNDARLPVLSNTSDTTRTVAELRGVTSVHASHYGTPLSYVPGDRPSNALDGDETTAWRVGAFADVRGERLKIDLGRPVRTGSITLVQPLYGPRNRFLTTVGVKLDGGREIPVQLGAASQTAAGQQVTFPTRSVRTVEIVLHDTNFGVLATYTGASGVGFSEVKIAGRTLDDVVRTPTDLLTGTGTDGHRLLLQFSRQRSDPASPVSVDAEPAMARAVTLPSGRSFGFAGTARVSDKASDQLLDSVLGTSTGAATFTSSSRLAGDLQSRASSAFDANAATLWSTAFGPAAGQWVQATTGSARTASGLDLEVVADGRHSVPTKLRLIVDGKASRELTVPAVTDRRTANATAAVHVSFPAVTGKSFRLQVDDVRHEQTVNFFTRLPYDEPVAIAEVGLSGVLASPPTAVDTGCRTDLMTIDGKPVAIRITGSASDAAARRPLVVRQCGPLRLSSGPHLLRTTVGTGTGVDIDRLLLASDRSGRALTLTPAGKLPTGADRWSGVPVMKVDQTSSTSYAVHVDTALQPFRLVLGESLSAGWHATVDGRSLGAAALVDGYANGWMVPAGSNLSIKLSWAPQRRVDIALLISAIAAALSLGIAAWGRGAPLGAPERDGDGGLVLDWLEGRGRPGWRRSTVAVVITGAFGGLVVNPVVGLFAAALTLVGAAAPRGRWVLRIGAVLGYALAAGYVLQVQLRYALPADFSWVQAFDNWSVDCAWLAVVLLVGEVLASWARRSLDGEPGGDRFVAARTADPAVEQ